MRHIGLLSHPRVPESSQLADEMCRTLARSGIEIWRGSADDELALEQVSPGLDLLVTLGGDGTIVRAVRVVAAHNVPILGINFGRLGFLAEVEPSEIDKALSLLLEGRYLVEERMMLRVTLYRGEDLLLDAEAINDAVVARGRVSRTVRVSVEVDGHHVMTPTSDGIIVSTPTGSTAYCLSAGGPIVAPDLSCLTVTPIAAHLGVAHAFVIPPHRCLCLRLMSGAGAMLTLDGQLDRELELGDRVYNVASKNTGKFVRFGGDGYYYDTVLRRLKWPDRRRSTQPQPG